ncbi:MAG: PKD domain-containing protein [Solirubrobacteraceae bacterium]|nr:PKD domain-containing protein [Solirubrobacteraceae bacterium]
MSLLRLLPAAALAAAALVVPATASAALTLTPTGVTVDHTGDSDGILSPGETFDFVTHFSNTGGGDYQGGRGQLGTSDQLITTVTSSAAFSENNGDVANDPSYPAVDLPSTGTTTPVRYRATLGTNFQCGKNAAFSVSVAGNDGTFGGAFNVPTGAAGAYRTYATSQAGATILNGTTTPYNVTVPTPASGDSVNDYVRGVQVHIDSLDYIYTPHWIKLQLVSPDGKTVTLFDDSERSAFPGNDEAYKNNHFTNLTFVSKGTPGAVDLQTDPDGLQSGATIQANDDLSALMSGAKRSGDWKLRVTDVDPPSDPRSFRRGRSAGTQAVGTLGSWRLGVAAAVCSATPGAKAGPDAWFGGIDPLVLDPATGGTLTASATVTKSDDPAITPPTITGYGWDTHTSAGAPGAYTDGSGNSITLPSQTRGTKAVKLRVTDSNGKVSTVERSVIFSELPVVEALTADPTQPDAGQTVSLSALISDSAGGDKITKIEFDLDDNGTFEATSSPSTVSGQPTKVTGAASTAFAEAGTHVVRVRATNDLGATAVKSLVITTANQDPIAKFAFTGYAVGVTPVLQVGQQITFDATTAFDPDGTIIGYEWNLDAGTTGNYIDQGSNKTYTTSYSQPGLYSVSLRVRDNLGATAVVEHDVKVTAAPTAKAVASTTTPQINQSVSFDGTGSTDSDGTLSAYAWDLDGNGSFETNGATASKSYPNAGTVAVKLKVTDNDGATNIAVLPITVQAAGGGGGGGGSGTPTPTPKPTATPTPPGGTGNPVTIPGGGGTINNPVVVDVAIAQAQVDSLNETNTDASDAIQLDDFAAGLSITAKQKAKKAYKNGVAVGFKATAKSKFTVKAMITKAAAKKAGIKSKTPMFTIGSGKATLTKGGTVKFVVKFKKAYAGKLKRQAKLVVSFRGVVVAPSGDKLALAKNVTIVK